MGRLGKKRNDLSICLDEIGESGYHLSCTKTKAWITDFLLETGIGGFRARDDLKILIDIFRAGNGFEIRGIITTTLVLGCVRCLDEFTFPFNAEFHYTLCPSNEIDSVNDMEIGKDDLDILSYESNFFDLTPLIEEQIIVNVPANPICRESCMGICQQCGTNLNLTDCQCDTSAGRGSAFEVLKNFPVKEKP